MFRSTSRALLVLTAIGLGACGGGGTKTTTTHKGAPHGRPAPPKPIATSRTGWDGYPFRLDVMSLQRSGSLASLTLRLTNTQPRDNGLNTGTNVRDMFGRRRFDASTDGIVLLDTTNGKSYPVARDDAGNCICDGSLNGNSVGNGQSTRLSATFGAPPPNVRTVSVFVPHFGTFTGVPISPGPPGGAPAGASGLAVDLDLETDAIDESVIELDTPHRTDIRLAADVLFRFNKSSLTSRADQVIAQVAAKIRSTSNLSGLHVDGYTDSKGSAGYNVSLSERRAQAVARALRSALGAGAPPMTVAGHGESDPVAPNTKPDGSDDPAGRALNRRVEVSYAH